MSRIVTPGMLVALLAGAILTGALEARAQSLPADRSETFRIYGSASLGVLPLHCTVTLRLHAVATGGGAVGWEVASAQVHKPGVLGLPDRDWTLTAPDLATADGLWWVAHADVKAPADADFSFPPVIEGLASADAPGYADERFYFSGTPPHDYLFFPPLWLLKYRFRLPYDETIGVGEEVLGEIDPHGGWGG